MHSAYILLYVKNKLNVDIEECFFIGDRESTDGLCAKNAGMNYLIIDKKGMAFKKLLKDNDKE